MWEQDVCFQMISAGGQMRLVNPEDQQGQRKEENAQKFFLFFGFLLVHQKLMPNNETLSKAPRCAPLPSIVLCSSRLPPTPPTSHLRVILEVKNDRRGLFYLCCRRRSCQPALQDVKRTVFLAYLTSSSEVQTHLVVWCRPPQVVQRGGGGGLPPSSLRP